MEAEYWQHWSAYSKVYVYLNELANWEEKCLTCATYQNTVNRAVTLYSPPQKRLKLNREYKHHLVLMLQWFFWGGVFGLVLFGWVFLIKICMEARSTVMVHMYMKWHTTALHTANCVIHTPFENWVLHRNAGVFCKNHSRASSLLLIKRVPCCPGRVQRGPPTWSRASFSVT